MTAATIGADLARPQLVPGLGPLAEPPDLDELVAARLRAKAVRAAEADGEARAAARRDRRNRVLLAVSGVAASILVIAGIAVAAGRSGSSSSSKNASATAPPTSGVRADLTRPVPALGSYTDAGALGSVAVNVAQQRATEKLVLGPANGPPTTAHSKTRYAAPGAQPTVSAQVGTSNDSAQFSSGAPAAAAGNAAKRAVAGSTQCSAAKFAGPGDRLSMQASATLDGRPVQVYVFAGDGEHTVVVLGPACALVNVQTLG